MSISTSFDQKQYAFVLALAVSEYQCQQNDANPHTALHVTIARNAAWNVLKLTSDAIQREKRIITKPHSNIYVNGYRIPHLRKRKNAAGSSSGR